MHIHEQPTTYSTQQTLNNNLQTTHGQTHATNRQHISNNRQTMCNNHIAKMHTHVHKNIHVRVRVHVHVHDLVHMRIHTRAHVHIHVHMGICICGCMCICKNMFLCVCMCMCRVRSHLTSSILTNNTNNRPPSCSHVKKPDITKSEHGATKRRRLSRPRRRPSRCHHHCPQAPNQAVDIIFAPCPKPTNANYHNARSQADSTMTNNELYNVRGISHTNDELATPR